jgi:hypothetical protein
MVVTFEDFDRAINDLYTFVTFTLTVVSHLDPDEVEEVDEETRSALLVGLTGIERLLEDAARETGISGRWHTEEVGR